MTNGGMSRSVVTALLIGCLVFGVLLGLIGTKGRGSSSSSNLREGNQIKEHAAEAPAALKAALPAEHCAVQQQYDHLMHMKTSTSGKYETVRLAREAKDNRKQLDPMMLPRAFNKVSEGLEAGKTVGAWGPEGDEKGDWNEVFGADEEFKAFEHLMAKDEEMSFMFSYEMEGWD